MVGGCYGERMDGGKVYMPLQHVNNKCMPVLL